MSVDLSKNERKILDEMKTHVSVKEAAIAAGINPNYANQYTTNIRKKIRSASIFLEDIRARCRQSKLVAKTLAEKR